VEQPWKQVTVVPVVTRDTWSRKWYASARMTGTDGRGQCSGFFDFAGAFPTEAEAMEYALTRGRERARALEEGPPVSDR